jgi:hypothetical protein
MNYRPALGLLALGLACILPAHAQPAKEAAFKAALADIVQKFVKRDSAGLAKYIDKKTGVYQLHRIGIQDTYDHHSSIGFSDTSYPYILYFKNVKLTPLIYGRLPTYDCEKWSKFGTFTDTTLRDNLLTKTALSRKRNINFEVSQEDLKKITTLESISRRVVIVNNNDWDYFVIYLSYINGKWVLTIIDNLTGDCSV